MDSHKRSVLAGLKEALACNLPLHDLVLFGSRARGDASADSDVDVLVVLNGPVPLLLRD